MAGNRQTNRRGRRRYFLPFSGVDGVDVCYDGARFGAERSGSKTLIALILALPLGAVIVFLIGLTIIGAGVNECYRGMTGKFQKDFRLRELGGTKRHIVGVLGALSFTARAVIFGLIGYFFIMAAIESNPNDAVGLDGALMTLAQSYYGKVLLFIASIGLIAHGVLSLYEAHYRRIC